MKSEYLLLVDRVINMNPAYIGKNDLSKLTKSQRKLLKECKKAILNPDSEIGLSNLRTEINYFIEKYDLYEIMTVKNSKLENYDLEEVFWSYCGTLEYLLEMLLKHYPKLAVEKKKIFEKYSPRLFSEIKKHEKTFINSAEPQIEIKAIDKEKITSKVFTRLELELKFINESLYIDYPSRAKKIQDLIKIRNHKVFNLIEIKGEVKTDTLHDYIRNYYSQSEEIPYFNDASEEKFKELYTKVKGYLGN